ncbi:MAG TPA: hypothetical protein VNC50_03390 [Planctomycetia bacterium]|nr:hypothetical protein [Planctomycetia bacterium]
MRTLLIVAFFLGSAVQACAAERYFALFFAYQSCDRKPEESHTFVEFIRAEVNAGVPPVILERNTISWLPRTLIVRIRAWRSEPGRNLTLDETFAAARCKEILAWGPYELTCEAYRLAMIRKRLLESGAMMYKAVDNIPGQSDKFTNCVHAVAEIDPDARRIGQYNVKYGEYATRQVIRHFERQDFLINPCAPHDDVYRALGLDDRRIDRRNDWPDRGNGFTKFLRSLFGAS